MKRVLLVLAAFAAIVAALLVVLTARAPGELPPPDPALPITFADGSELPLSQVLDLVAKGEPLPAMQASSEDDARAEDAPVTAPVATIGEAKDGLAPAWPPPSPAERAARFARDHAQLVAWYGPVFALARESLDRGELEQAQALFQSLPEDHPSYGEAQRAIAWDIMTRRLDQPSHGIAFVRNAMLAQPLDGNSWQDAARVYGSVLGFTMR